MMVKKVICLEFCSISVYLVITFDFVQMDAVAVISASNVTSENTSNFRTNVECHHIKCRGQTSVVQMQVRVSLRGGGGCDCRYFTARVRITTGGYVFRGVSLSVHTGGGGGVPHLHPIKLALVPCPLLGVTPVPVR